jgi:hypothetical protein
LLPGEIEEIAIGLVELNSSKMSARAGASRISRNNQACRFLIRQEVRHGSETYPSEKARGGEIILNTPACRAIFLAGLVGTVVLAVILMVAR